MAKKEFNLQNLINLQKTVETMISNTTYEIIANNASLKSAKGDKIDVHKLYDKLLSLYVQLDVVKLAKDKANRSKTSLGKTNQQLIFELSTLNRKRSMLEVLFEQKKKVDKYEFQIAKTEIESRLDITKERITEIKETMTDFNNSHTVKIVIDADLDLI